MIKTTEQTKALNKALLQAQKSIQAVEKDSANPHFKSRYASLTAVLQAVKEPLNAAGLLLTQSVVSDVMAPGGDRPALFVTTRITHAETSEWMETCIPIPLDGQTAQKVGSATAYGRRYGLASLLALSEADDDGQAASQQTARQQRPAATNGAHAATEADWAKTAGVLIAEIQNCKTHVDVTEWREAAGSRVNALPKDQKQRVTAVYFEHEENLRPPEPAA